MTAVVTDFAEVARQMAQNFQTSADLLAFLESRRLEDGLYDEEATSTINRAIYHAQGRRVNLVDDSTALILLRVANKEISNPNGSAGILNALGYVYNNQPVMYKAFDALVAEGVTIEPRTIQVLSGFISPAVFKNHVESLHEGDNWYGYGAGEFVDEALRRNEGLVCEETAPLLLRLACIRHFLVAQSLYAVRDKDRSLIIGNALDAFVASGEKIYCDALYYMAAHVTPTALKAFIEGNKTEDGYAQDTVSTVNHVLKEKPSLLCAETREAVQALLASPSRRETSMVMGDLPLSATVASIGKGEQPVHASFTLNMKR